MKQNEFFFAEQILLQFNQGVASSNYAGSFKFANITPAFTEGSRNLKDDYRLISILPAASKIFEKLMCKQISDHLDRATFLTATFSPFSDK